MRVELLESRADGSQRLIGEVILRDDGSVRYTTDAAQRVTERLADIWDPDARAPVTMEETERYLRLMPVAMRGQSLRARFVE